MQWPPVGSGRLESLARAAVQHPAQVIMVMELIFMLIDKIFCFEGYL